MVLGSQAACPGPLTPGAPQRQNKISVIHSIVVVLAIFVAVAIAIAVCLSRYPVIVPLVFHRGLPVFGPSRYPVLLWLSFYPVIVQLVFRRELPVLVAFPLFHCLVAPRNLLGNCVHAVVQR